MVFMMGMNVISAKTYYTDYSDFSDFTATPIYGNDTVNVETEMWYTWYREEKELGPYQNQYLSNMDYPLIDYEDSIEGEWSSWGYEEPENILERIIQRRSVYRYQDMKEIRYLQFYGLSGSNQRFYISELEVSVNGNPVDYTVLCDQCGEHFKQSIQNGDQKETDVYVSNGTDFWIDLNNYYPADTITFDLYLYDTGTKQKDYRVRMTHDIESGFHVYFDGYWIQCFTYQSADDIVPITHTIEQMVMTNPEWYEPKEMLEEVEASLVRKVEKRNQYRYIDYVPYRRYRIKKVYREGYWPSGTSEYPYVDVTNCKVHFRSQVRDKLVLKDPLVIDTATMKIQDLILESSQPVETEGTVDMTQNGEYPITFKMGDLIVTENVTVDILENTIQEEKIEALNKTIEEQRQMIEQLEEEKESLKEMLTEERDQNASLQQNITALEEALKKLMKEKETLMEELTVLKKDYEKLQAKEAEKQEELVDLKGQIESLEEQLITKQKEIAKWEDQQHQLSLEKQNLQEKMDILEIEKQEWHGKALLHEEEINTLKLKVNTLISENQTLLMRIDQLVQEKENLVGDYQQELIQLDLRLTQEKTKLEEVNASEYKCRSELEKIQTTDMDNTPSEGSHDFPQYFIYGVCGFSIVVLLIGIWWFIRSRKQK